MLLSAGLALAALLSACLANRKEGTGTEKGYVSLMQDRFFKRGFNVWGLGLPVYGDEIELYGGDYEKQTSVNFDYDIAQAYMVFGGIPFYLDLIDRRYNKEGAYNIVFTSNRSQSLWRENFNEEDSLLCALDRIFDDATVFNIHGESFRGKRLETYALQAGKATTKGI